MAGKPGEVDGPPGQCELFRQYALGNFRDLLIAVAKDPAMLVWLDADSVSLLGGDFRAGAPNII
jgi:uncharacterized protein (DUF1800 family)